MSWGAFGKMPGLGDFFRAGIAADFVTAWDGWLQGLLLAGRTQLGAEWDETYLTAPLWRFALGPGVAGEAAVAGVLMPSVDRVGRQFPLTLAVPAEGSALMLLTDPVWEAAEDLALDCLEDGMTREVLQARLAELAAPQARGGVHPLGGGVEARGHGMSGALAALVPAGGAVVFATEGRVLVLPALPGPEAAGLVFGVGAGGGGPS